MSRWYIFHMSHQRESVTLTCLKFFFIYFLFFISIQLHAVYPSFAHPNVLPFICSKRVHQVEWAGLSPKLGLKFQEWSDGPSDSPKVRKHLKSISFGPQRLLFYISFGLGFRSNNHNHDFIASINHKCLIL